MPHYVPYCVLTREVSAKTAVFTVPLVFQVVHDTKWSLVIRDFFRLAFPTLVFHLQVYADTGSGDEVPSLYLNGTRADGSLGLPAVLDSNTSLATSPSDELTFIYTVLSGDRASGITEI